PLTYFYSLSLHDALPIFLIMSIAVMIFRGSKWDGPADMPQERDFATYVFAARAIVDNPLNLYHERLWIRPPIAPVGADQPYLYPDRKSTRLNSSHLGISY